MWLCGSARAILEAPEISQAGGATWKGRTTSRVGWWLQYRGESRSENMVRSQTLAAQGQAELAAAVRESQQKTRDKNPKSTKTADWTGLPRLHRYQMAALPSFPLHHEYTYTVLRHFSSRAGVRRAGRSRRRKKHVELLAGDAINNQRATSQSELDAGQPGRDQVPHRCNPDR